MMRTRAVLPGGMEKRGGGGGGGMIDEREMLEVRKPKK